MQIGMESLVIDLAKEEACIDGENNSAHLCLSIDGENNSAYLCLLLAIKFLSRLCNIFLARSIALKECYLLMNF